MKYDLKNANITTLTDLTLSGLFCNLVMTNQTLIALKLLSDLGEEVSHKILNEVEVKYTSEQQEILNYKISRAVDEALEDKIKKSNVPSNKEINNIHVKMLDMLMKSFQGKVDE